MNLAAETLTTGQLNRALLARQHLLERATAPITRVIEDVGGLQTQYAPAGYIALWSRIANFERSSLTRAIEAREAIHGTLMRVTIHTVSALDYWPMAIAVRRSRREWLNRVTSRQRDGLDLSAAADAVREILRDGSVKGRDITRRVVERGFPAQAAGWSSAWVDTVRVPPSGTWERRADDLYALAEQWLPPAEIHPDGLPTEEDGIRLLLKRYLDGFGPARPADFADWAGIPMNRGLPIIATTDLRRFRDEAGRELIDLPEAPLPAADTRAPVRFLPPFDPTLLVNCRRTQILPEEYRPRIFNTQTPWSTGAFLVDGHVAGTWRHEAGNVRTEAFVALPDDAQREVEAEAAALAQFHN